MVHKRNDVRLLLRILLCIWFRSGEIVHTQQVVQRKRDDVDDDDDVEECTREKKFKKNSTNKIYLSVIISLMIHSSLVHNLTFKCSLTLSLSLASSTFLSFTFISASAYRNFYFYFVRFHLLSFLHLCLFTNSIAQLFSIHSKDLSVCRRRENLK